MAKRRNYSAESKSKVALAAIRGEGAVAELSSRCSVHYNMIAKCKRDALDGMKDTFQRGPGKDRANHADQIRRLQAKIGELVVERGFFIQSLRPLSVGRRRNMIEPKHKRLSVVCQSRLVSISRSTSYYQRSDENPLNRLLMQFDR